MASLTSLPILSLIVFLPLLGSLILMLLRGEKALKIVALVVSLATFLISLVLYFGWKQGDPGMQFFETVPWVPQLGISYTCLLYTSPTAHCSLPPRSTHAKLRLDYLRPTTPRRAD